MKHIELHRPSAGHLDYATASALAAACAQTCPDMEAPVLVAWHDRRLGRMSPAIAGADPETRWRDYGASHDGCLEVDVDEDYQFVFADAAAFEGYGPSPYVNLADGDGREYVCQLSAMRDPHRPDAIACMALDEYTSKLT